MTARCLPVHSAVALHTDFLKLGSEDDKQQRIRLGEKTMAPNLKENESVKLPLSADLRTLQSSSRA